MRCPAALAILLLGCAAEEPPPHHGELANEDGGVAPDARDADAVTAPDLLPEAVPDLSGPGTMDLAPSRDLAPVPLPDLAPLLDLAPAHDLVSCGMIGMACCDGTSCTEGSCLYHNVYGQCSAQPPSLCIAVASNCGSFGLVPCGANGQPDSSGYCSRTGYAESNGKCTWC